MAVVAWTWIMDSWCSAAGVSCIRFMAVRCRVASHLPRITAQRHCTWLGFGLERLGRTSQSEDKKILENTIHATSFVLWNFT